MSYEIIISAQHLGVIKIKKNKKIIEKISRPESYKISNFDKKIFKNFKPISIIAFGLQVCVHTYKYK